MPVTIEHFRPSAYLPALLPYLIIFAVLLVLPNNLIGNFSTQFTIAFLFISISASYWEGQVTDIVPQPYLDEVFHIPQAQAYCQKRYDIWDPKLTTPPGLYLVTQFFILLTKPRSSHFTRCTPHTLRGFNITALLATFYFAHDCRRAILLPPSSNPGQPRKVLKTLLTSISFDSVHTTLNIALFPPLFFFSGLFYTDVLSTCMVFLTYKIFLSRDAANSGWRLFAILPLGILALGMRQTNIFWVAIFLGALEMVRILKAISPENKPSSEIPTPPSGNLKERVTNEVMRYTAGEIHDPLLAEATLLDFLLTPLSLLLAFLSIITQPAKLSKAILTLSPYIALLASFLAFIVWNGGVVLGDKSNHVATIHLPQLLYIWPFITFFSLPLILPVAISWVQSTANLLAIPQFPRLRLQILLTLAGCGIALGGILVVIKYNTIIHPFTLADNRHYMFYVFRYTILRHPLIRYLLAPIYLLTGYFVYLTFSAIPSTSATPPSQPVLKNPDPQSSPKPMSPSKTEKPKKEVSKVELNGPTTSFTLILLVTTALSLITAPLVEPRYFILPWVMWRLHLPSPFPSTNASATDTSPSTPRLTPAPSIWSKITKKVEIVNALLWENRLWMETAWFIIINVVTGYIFLYRGFEWKQEPGMVQRFMW